jgi:hypothetical protein
MHMPIAPVCWEPADAVPIVADMSGLERAVDRLEDAVSVVGRVVELAFLALLGVALLCIIVVIVAGTYGMLHKGDDFGNLGGGGGGGGGDIVFVGGLG